MPESPPWWELFEVKEAEVFDVATVLCHLYHQPRAQRLPLVPPPPGAPAPAAGAGSKSPLTQVGGARWLARDCGRCGVILNNDLLLPLQLGFYSNLQPSCAVSMFHPFAAACRRSRRCAPPPQQRPRWQDPC